MSKYLFALLFAATVPLTNLAIAQDDAVQNSPASKRSIAAQKFCQSMTTTAPLMESLMF